MPLAHRLCTLALVLLAALPHGAGAADAPDGAGAGDAADRAEAPPSLEALMAGMAGTPGVVARFREVKQLALLSEPLESRGTLTFVPPDRLARVTTRPVESRLVIDGDAVHFRDAAGGEALDLSENPVAREYVSNFMVLFNGDLDALRERYAPDYAVGGDGGWSLVLRPRRRPLADLVDRVVLHGRGRALVRMELHETDGDRTTTFFEQVEVDRRFDAAELERIFSPDGAP